MGNGKSRELYNHCVHTSAIAIIKGPIQPSTNTRIYRDTQKSDDKKSKDPKTSPRMKRGPSQIQGAKMHTESAERLPTGSPSLIHPSRASACLLRPHHPASSWHSIPPRFVPSITLSAYILSLSSPSPRTDSDTPQHRCVKPSHMPYK